MVWIAFGSLATRGFIAAIKPKKSFALDKYYTPFLLLAVSFVISVWLVILFWNLRQLQVGIDYKYRMENASVELKKQSSILVAGASL